MARCLVIVPRDQPGLFERLTSLYRDEAWIAILLDRRHEAPGNAMASGSDRRSPPSSQTDLRERSYLVIRRSSRRAPVADDPPG